MIFAVLVVSGRKGSHQLPFVRQAQGGAVDHKHRPRHVRHLFPHQPLQLFRYVVAHVAGYQGGHLLPRLAIAARAGGDAVLADALAHMRLRLPVHHLVRQKVYRRRARTLAMQPLVDHQPDDHRQVIDSSPKFRIVFSARLVDGGGGGRRL
jgi:hypothetical protein